MKSTIRHLAILLACLLPVQPGCGETEKPSELQSKLSHFGSYEFGQPKKALHAAKMAAYRGTEDEGVRAKNEGLLLAFVESAATIDARREACLWLGNLGTEASVPVLERLLSQKDFSDVAQISLDAVKGWSASAPDFSTALRAFEEEVMGSQKPLALLVAAWRGEDDARSRHAFELVRNGVEAKKASQWLADHHSELPPLRQIITMHLLLDTGSPHRAAVIEALSRGGKGEVRQVAIRNLGFLQRQQDVQFLHDHYHGADEKTAEAARQALLSLPLPLIQKHLIQDLKSSDPATQARAIELAESTRAAAAAPALVSISKSENNPNRVAAARSLGKAAPPAMLKEMIELFMQSIGSPLEAPYKQALWDLARKQDDYAATQRLLQSHAARAKNKTAQRVMETLGSRLNRITSPKP